MLAVYVHVPRLYTRETFWALQLLVPQLFAKRNATGTRLLHVHTRYGGPWYVLVHVLYSAAAVDLGQHLGMDATEEVQVSIAFFDPSDIKMNQGLHDPSSFHPRSVAQHLAWPTIQTSSQGGRCALRRWDASSLPGVEQKASIGTWHIAAKPRGKSVFFTSPNLRPCKFDLASTQPFPGRQPQD